MRPLIALAIVVLVFGSVEAYMLFQDSLPVADVAESVVEHAGGKFSVELTLTFDAAPDGFALEPVSALVQFDGKDLFRSAERIAAGTSIVIDNVKDILAGKNDFYVKIVAADERFDLQHAVRLRVLRNGAPIAEHTLWSDPGEPVEGVVRVDVPAHVPVSHPHEH